MTRDPVVVVGSGASGVQFAQTLLSAGRAVTLLDVGHPRPAPALPDRDLAALRTDLDDPLAYFLGRDFESVVLPGHAGEYYGFPPGKDYVFRDVPGTEHASDGFAPLFSYAQGGLAEAWTGGSYPFDDRDLAEFPFGYAELAPHYGEVARRIGVSGAEDDLARFLPVHEGLGPPLDLDAHSLHLVERYERRRASLASRHRFFLGRSRSAVLSRPLDGRPACDQLGRCLWGCPTDAFYTPSVALRRLAQEPRFRYVAGLRATHFATDAEGRVRRVHAVETASGAPRDFDVGTLVLAAGTLASARIFLESFLRDGRDPPALEGLCDNRQVLMPFLSARRVGARPELRSYQYHQLAVGLEPPDGGDYVHGLVTTLKTAMAHPIVQSLPLSLRSSVRTFRDVRAALGLLNVNFADRRRPGNTVSLEPRPGRPPLLRVRYRPEASEAPRVAAALATMRAALRELGCLVPRGLTHVRPMGASVHYTGTLPMTAAGAPMTTDPFGESRDFGGLYLCDGSTFPALPAKNLTFTLMANAVRIARERFV